MTRSRDSTRSAARKIVRYFDSANRKVYSSAQILNLSRQHRNLWDTPISATAYFEFLHELTHFRHSNLSSPNYPAITRYIWREASPYEVALSLGPKAFLSHGTAAFLHSLSPSQPKVIHVNQEQRPKGSFDGQLTQDAIHSAFSREPRVSKRVYRYRRHRILLISGKHTGRLGVITINPKGAGVLPVTCLERTLIDISVRPVYAGGVKRVRKAFRAAKGRLSPSELFRMLRELDYVYPYHQVLGFYLDKSGYSENEYQPFLQLPIEFDFYITHGLADPQYDRRWRLFYPSDL